ncbi:hypothetical protein CEN44_14680 [Fischerella muscicola CCMEE 5323]|uniref:Uncharacterized protein n=1 Tax=Fischerella muscicola CCMEE 5323 TaxID=2019572 RepID=A0A2N6K1U1_FISMU|nr:hypothetical protein CEN44_14680 [Fischerella muscicola CCMEE 5323]
MLRAAMLRAEGRRQKAAPMKKFQQPWMKVFFSPTPHTLTPPHPLSRQRAEGKNQFLPLPFMVLYPLLS